MYWIIMNIGKIRRTSAVLISCGPERLIDNLLDNYEYWQDKKEMKPVKRC